jgi:ribonuclease HII
VSAFVDPIGGRVAPPTLDAEAKLWARGLRRVAGVDEAGRGALAGPVVAAAVIVPPGASITGVWSEVRDSKLLSPPRRSALATAIGAAAWAWGVGIIPAAVIDGDGIAAATRQAMQQAIAALAARPDYLLVDWVRLPSLNIPQLCVAKADRTMVSVAAASILAKVTRDRLMVALDAAYPGYGFAVHKGYGTQQHLAALASQGPCGEHRRSFAPLAHQATLFDAFADAGSAT